jgi:hypothetical protein
MKKKDVYKALDKILAHVSKLDTDSFRKELQPHYNGDISKIILDSRFLEVGKIESQHLPSFDDWELTTEAYSSPAVDPGFQYVSTQDIPLSFQFTEHDIIFSSLEPIWGAVKLNIIDFKTTDIQFGKAWVVNAGAIVKVAAKDSYVFPVWNCEKMEDWECPIAA